MRKLPTGEPCAGEPHARFGGRGRRKPFPDPYQVCFPPQLAWIPAFAGMTERCGYLAYWDYSIYRTPIFKGGRRVERRRTT
jgi:hypothetical protein